MESLNTLVKKFFTKEIVMYLIFGILTTLVNWIVFFVLINLAHLEEILSNAISIIVSVFFAYVTNERFVFTAKTDNFKQRFTQFYKFIIGRGFTMLLEFFGFFLLFNIIGISQSISKISITVIVVILNYIVSKFFAFK